MWFSLASTTATPNIAINYLNFAPSSTTRGESERDRVKTERKSDNSEKWGDRESWNRVRRRVGIRMQGKEAQEHSCHYIKIERFKRLDKVLFFSLPVSRPLSLHIVDHV